MTIISFLGAWLLQQAGGALFNLATQRMLESMGLGSLVMPSGVKSLLDEYLQRLIARLDEDRIAKLYGAFSQLRDASKTAAKQAFLEQALDRFHDVINLPEQGKTGDYQNAQLRCLAFLGMAATHSLLNDPQELIAEKIVEAVYADHSTAQRFLDKSVVRPLLAFRNHTLIGHNASVRDIVFSPDGETLASGGEDNTIRLWDAKSGDLLRTYTEHQGWVNSLAFSPDGKILASGGGDKSIRLWDVEVDEEGNMYLVTRQILTVLPSWVNSLAFSPDGKILASGGGDKSVRLWDVLTGQLRETLIEHNRGVTSVAFSPDGKILASGSIDQTIRLWYLEDGEWQRGWQRFLSGQSDTIWSVAFSPDGNTLASGVANGGVQLWNVKKTGLPQTFSATGIMSVAFSPDGETLASGSSDKTIKLWNVKTGHLSRQLEGHLSSVHPIAFSPDGETLASGSSDKTIRLWRMKEEEV